MSRLLSTAHIALIEQGTSVIVSSHDARLRPSVMRAMGAQVSADGACVTVYLRPSQARQLLDDLSAGGPIAVVFSDPPTNRTLQIKASGAYQRNVTHTDQAVLRRYQAAMQQRLGSIGFTPEYVAAILAAPVQDLMALECTPESAFDQTPGPRAGRPVSVSSPS